MEEFEIAPHVREAYFLSYRSQSSKNLIKFLQQLSDDITLPQLILALTMLR
jgi:hypothetical protein